MLQYTDEELDGGIVSVLVKYRDIITVINKTLKICELTAAVQTSCPIEEGNHKIVVTETFPSYAPSVSPLFVWIQSYSTIEPSLNACMIRVTIAMYISCPLHVIARLIKI